MLKEEIHVKPPTAYEDTRQITEEPILELNQMPPPLQNLMITTSLNKKTLSPASSQPGLKSNSNRKGLQEVA